MMERQLVNMKVSKFNLISVSSLEMDNIYFAVVHLVNIRIRKLFWEKKVVRELAVVFFFFGFILNQKRELGLDLRTVSKKTISQKCY